VQVFDSLGLRLSCQLFQNQPVWLDYIDAEFLWPDEHEPQQQLFLD